METLTEQIYPKLCQFLMKLIIVINFVRACQDI